MENLPIIFPENIYREGMINFAAYSSVFSLTVGFAYVLGRQQKMAYYFHWTADRKANWLNSVFENMNERIDSVRGLLISYIYPFLHKLYQKRTDVKFDKSATNSKVSDSLGKY